MTPKERVLQEYPEAFIEYEHEPEWEGALGYMVNDGTGNYISNEEATEALAWQNAAERLTNGKCR